MERNRSNDQKKVFSFFDGLSEHPKKYFVRLLFVLLVSLIITMIMFIFSQKIREEQVNSLVYADIHSPKLQPLNLNEAPKKIEESKAISVLFSVPNGEKYQELLKIFHNSKKMNELNRSIYFYPLLYNVKELEQRYNINQEQITIIFFKEGKEANRLSLETDQSFNLSEELIPELNRLPLTNIKKLSLELREGESTNSMQTSPEKNTDHH